MRALKLLLPGLGLMAASLGCCSIQHTAGICDCNPPQVESVLLPPPRPAPMAGLYANGVGLPASVNNAVPHHAPTPGVIPPSHVPPVNDNPTSNTQQVPVQQPLSILPPVKAPVSPLPPMPKAQENPSE